jgi:hypothetical protein
MRCLGQNENTCVCQLFFSPIPQELPAIAPIFSGSMLPSQNELVPSLVVNKEDHGALVTITGAFCLTTSGLFFLARLSIRWPWERLLGRDDMLTAATTVRRSTVCMLYNDRADHEHQLFAFLQTSFVLASVSEGLGKIPERISSAALEKLLKVRSQNRED